MKIIIDIDGVIRNINKAIVKVCKDHLDKNISESNINNWDLVKCIGVNPKWLFTTFGKQIFADAEIYRESFIALSALIFQHNLVLVSKQLNDTNKGFTNYWLSKNKISIPVIYTENKNEVESDVIIDDYPGNLTNHNAKYKFLFDQPHNQNCKDFKRVYNLFHFIHELRKIK